MMNLEEFYHDQLSKTSPVHKPAFDIDFSYQLGLQSPSSVPTNTFERAQFNERYADLKDPIGYDDIVSSYHKIIQTDVPLNEKNSLKRKRKKKPQTFKPFASFEATELVVHQLRSVFAKAAYRKPVL
jgi:hypothetical protein